MPAVVVAHQGGIGDRYTHEQRGVPSLHSHLRQPIPRRPEWPWPEAYPRIEFHHPIPALWSWRPEWHQPQPGMLLQALEDLAVAPTSDALMVGDWSENREAARTAGVPFRWATADWMLC